MVWDADNDSFLKSLKWIKEENFATKNAKRRPKIPASEITMTAESLMDIFIRMIIVVSQNNALDLQNILSYPITAYPLSLAHSDGTLVKTDRSVLLRR